MKCIDISLRQYPKIQVAIKLSRELKGKVMTHVWSDFRGYKQRFPGNSYFTNTKVRSAGKKKKANNVKNVFPKHTHSIVIYNSRFPAVLSVQLAITRGRDSTDWEAVRTSCREALSVAAACSQCRCSVVASREQKSSLRFLRLCSVRRNNRQSSVTPERRVDNCE